MDEVVAIWKQYLSTVTSWQDLIKGNSPKTTPCGPVYELTNPIERPNESFAIADMRNVTLAEPHYHRGGETEIYIVLTGSGVSVVDGEERQLEPGYVCVTPPETSHFTIPKEKLVLAVINTPPFKAENTVFLTESNPSVGFNADQLASFTT